jgi:ABC-type antimicrobial peptide transport system permease subunit
VTGAAYVFVRSGTTWAQQAKLTQTTPTLDSFVGSDVDIDGNVAVVGALQESVGNQRYGAAYVFERSGTTWTSTRIPAPTPRADLDQFGGGVGVSGTAVGVACGLVLVVAALGIIGVLGFLVTTRAREFAIRMALGSTRRRVFCLMRVSEQASSLADPVRPHT